MKNKIDINLNGVPKTLLVPLIGRAYFSLKPYSPIHDKKAIELVNSINYDFKHLLKCTKPSTLFTMIRAYHFDEAIKEFLKHHPKGTIIDLGAGLDTGFYRVDNGELTWVDLDVPEVIELRNKLLPPAKRVHCIAKSILDFSWINDVQPLGNPIFLFAGGLFVYLNEEQVKTILLEIAKYLPGSEIVFDTISNLGLRFMNKMMLRANIKNAPLKWTFDNHKTLTGWSPKIKIVSQSPYFRHLKQKSDFPLLLRPKMWFYDRYIKTTILHLKFE